MEVKDEAWCAQNQNQGTIVVVDMRCSWCQSPGRSKTPSSQGWWRQSRSDHRRLSCPRCWWERQTQAAHMGAAPHLIGSGALTPPLQHLPLIFPSNGFTRKKQFATVLCLLLLIDVTHPPSTRFVRLHSIAKSKQYLFDFYPVFHKKFINCELSNRRRSTVLQYQWFGKNLEELEKLRMKIVLHLTNFAQSWHSTCLDIFIGFFALLLFSKTQHWRPHPTPPLLCISDIHMTAAPPPLTNEIPFQKLPPNKSPSFPKPASYLSNSPGTIFQHVSYF